jgi:hypothetical protein
MAGGYKAKGSLTTVMSFPPPLSLYGRIFVITGLVFTSVGGFGVWQFVKYNFFFSIFFLGGGEWTLYRR